ncbi:M15 family metallopeptidase [Nocardioides sp. LHG3406-4]|uniref:M15 family metallopeptidase n=1 Tax=Nocardioides sp. LHG3406-4 TaxID=2804575 RepID=UPI003CF940FA
MLRGLLVVAMCAVLLQVAAPTQAATGTVTSMTGTSARAGETTSLGIAVTDAAGTPLPGVLVTVERLAGGAWAPVGEVVTDAQGHAAIDAALARSAGDNVFRAAYAGDATYTPSSSGAVPIALVRRASILTLTAPPVVVDEQSVQLVVGWRTDSGEGVAGPVQVQLLQGGRWLDVATPTTDAAGQATVTYAPRDDVTLRAVAPTLDWVVASISSSRRIDNRPPAQPVSLPRKAPHPRIVLPPQPRAVGSGADAVVTRIPNNIWREMSGVTWHAGCPVGRARLRLIRVNYWGYDGYRHRGELVIHAAASEQFVGALTEIYDRRLPIRSMYRVDRFGWSPRLRGGDDYASMAAGNSSAFNCRYVVNRPGVRSPHSYGRSFDINTWENPFRSATGLVPNDWWQSRSDPRVAWRSGSHPMVRLMRRHGFSWTYGTGDSQHFDARGPSGRIVHDQRCVGVCH